MAWKRVFPFMTGRSQPFSPITVENPFIPIRHVTRFPLVTIQCQLLLGTCLAHEIPLPPIRNGFLIAGSSNPDDRVSALIELNRANSHLFDEQAVEGRR
jgi:hypothetical protein